MFVFQESGLAGSQVQTNAAEQNDDALWKVVSLYSAPVLVPGTLTVSPAFGWLSSFTSAQAATDVPSRRVLAFFGSHLL